MDVEVYRAGVIGVGLWQFMRASIGSLRRITDCDAKPCSAELSLTVIRLPMPQSEVKCTGPYVTNMHLGLLA